MTLLNKCVTEFAKQKPTSLTTRSPPVILIWLLLVGVLDKMVIDRDPAVVLHWPPSSQVWRWLLLWLLVRVVIHVIVLVRATRHVGGPRDHGPWPPWAGAHVIWMELRAHGVSWGGHQVSRLLTHRAVGVHHTPSPYIAGRAARNQAPWLTDAVGTLASGSRQGAVESRLDNPGPWYHPGAVVGLWHVTVTPASCPAQLPMGW